MIGLPPSPRVALVAALAVLVLAGCARAPRAEGSRHSPRSAVMAGGIAAGLKVFAPSQRQPLPTITGTTLSGARLALRSLIGRRIIVVNVWASWCENCRAESAALARLSSSMRDRALFIGIDEQDRAGAARTFVKAAGTEYPQLSDPTGTALAKLSVLPSFGIPSTLVVDRQGMMAARVVGPTNDRQLRELVAQIAAES